MVKPTAISVGPMKRPRKPKETKPPNTPKIVRLIGFGVAMPMSLTILGVFGGFVAFGFLGLFIGPTLIAIAFTLLEAWRGAPAATPGSAVQ